MSLMLPLSSSLLRQKSYEIFLVLHIVLSLVTLISLFLYVFPTHVFSSPSLTPSSKPHQDLRRLQ